MKPRTFVCIFCGKEFRSPNYRGERKYCSVVCRHAHQIGVNAANWQGGIVETVCQFCGKEFSPRHKEEKPKFCSMKCKGNAQSLNKGINSSHWKGGPKEFECINCHRTFTDKVASIRKFCSHSCHDKWRAKNTSGSNSPTWQGGKSFEPYPPIFNDQFKRMIRERDNYTCKICGSRGNIIHHINYVKDDTVPENCITLCRSCHSRTNSNRESWRNKLSNL